MHNGTASTPPRIFIRKALPSMTPRPPGGETLPSPSTRVESLTTATTLPRQESSNDSAAWSRMRVDTAETPGVYHALIHASPGKGARGNT